MATKIIEEYGYYFIEFNEPQERTVAEFSSFGWMIIGSDDSYPRSCFSIIKKLEI